MTKQEQLKEKLESLGLPYKDIKVFGLQIIVKSHCENTAKKWAAVLSKLTNNVRVVPHTEEAVVNKNTVLLPTTVKVWLTGATLQ